MSTLGSDMRLRRLRDPRGRLFLLALDHGLPAGPLPGLEDPGALLRAIQGSPVTGLIANPGLVARLAATEGRLPPFIVHLSAGTILARHPTSKVLSSSVEHALALGADAVSVQIHLGDPAEGRMLRAAGDVVRAAAVHGLPVLVMAHPPRPTAERTEPGDTPHAARVAAEVGADLVQVPHPGSRANVRSTVRGCPVPVVVAGGPRVGSPESYLESIRVALAGGAAGVSVGRYLFQDPDPATMARRIGEVLAAPVPAGILVKA